METWYPADLPTALEVLARHPGAVPLAGGTDLMVDVNSGRRELQGVISLRRVRELQALDGDRIGAGVRWKRLLAADDTALAQAARSIGSPQIRAAGTIGGNLATASPAGDGLVVLAALDASIEVASYPRGSRLIRWSDFLTGPKQTSLAPDELITAVHLPPDRPRQSEFVKVGVRGAMVIAVVNACVAKSPSGRVAIALGSVAPTVVRARTAERLVNEAGGYSDALAAAVADAIRADIAPITDHRSTAEYRHHAAGVIVRRLLERMAAS